uniref:Uncharacterized protein n=1 Tax=Oryza meridionalis TaxID=40149 RepID=A0A0E0DXB1_9ORYZ
MEDDEMREKLATMDERQAMEMRFTWISELIASNKKETVILPAQAVIKTMIDSVRAATPAAGDATVRRRGADDNDSGAIGCGPTHRSRTISRM